MRYSCFHFQFLFCSSLVTLIVPCIGFSPLGYRVTAMASMHDHLSFSDHCKKQCSILSSNPFCNNDIFNIFLGKQIFLHPVYSQEVIVVCFTFRSRTMNFANDQCMAVSSKQYFHSDSLDFSMQRIMSSRQTVSYCIMTLICPINK